MENDSPIMTHCLELNTENKLTGIYKRSAKGIAVDIYSYQDFFFIDPEQPIFLRTENNDYVSLHSNICAGPATSTRHIDPQITTYKQEIISNIAIHGHNLWTNSDLVKRVYFNVDHTTSLLRNKSKMDVLENSRYPDEKDLLIYSEKILGMRIGARYGAIYNMNSMSPNKIWPVFFIEFDEAKSIHGHLNFVRYYVAFLSFCLGTKLKPSEIHIDRLSEDEMLKALDAKNYLGNHQVYYIWPDLEIESHRLWIGGSPVISHDDQDLASFRECLISWMNRASAWEKPNTLMMMSFALDNIVSGDRLIASCRWLEDIPTARSKNIFSKDKIEIISDYASSKALELGFPSDIAKRILGSIKSIKSESSEQRFFRLLTILRDKFGENILRGSALNDLKAALSFRGKTAHGHFSPESDNQYQEFVRSIMAMEAFCYLLTANELPITKDGIERISHNPIISNYNHGL